MKFARCLSFLLIGMFTSMVFLSVAFRLDFKLFARDLFTPLKSEDTFTAAFTAPEQMVPIVVPDEIDEIAVASQVTMHWTLSNSVTLSGVVPSWKICEEVEGYCKQIFPDMELSNEIRVFARASQPKWMDSLRVMSELRELSRVRNTSIAFADDIIEMTGSVPTKELKSELLAVIESKVSGVEVPMAARLGVVAVAPELDIWMADEGTLLVQGVLDAKTKEVIVSKIQSNLGEGRRMIESIAIDVDAVEPTWLPAVEMLLPDFLVNVVPEQLKVKEGEFVLRGATSTAKIADAFAHYVKRAFPDERYRVTNSLVVQDGLALAGGGKMMLSSEALASASDSLFDVMEASTVYFGSGSTGLGAGDKRRLKKLAAILKRDGVTTIEIAGHCDPSGDPELNARLAKLRCESAHNYLVSEGVPSERFLVNAVGVSTSSSGKASEQRRVEFRISSGLLAEMANNEAAVETIRANAALQPITLDGDEGERLVKVQEYAGSTKVYFDTAKHSISREHQQQLDQLAAYLRSFDKTSPQLYVRGLADPRGDATFNLQLSARRCRAVVDYLESKGVRKDVITMEEMGATEVNVDDSAALRESRRVEFSLMAPQVTNA